MDRLYLAEQRRRAGRSPGGADAGNQRGGDEVRGSMGLVPAAAGSRDTHRAAIFAFHTGVDITLGGRQSAGKLPAASAKRQQPLCRLQGFLRLRMPC